MKRILFGYIARETDKATAFVDGGTRVDAKPLWIPNSKILGIEYPDTLDIDVQLKGELAHRQAIPATISVDGDFLAKIGV